MATHSRTIRRFAFLRELPGNSSRRVTLPWMKERLGNDSETIKDTIFFVKCNTHITGLPGCKLIFSRSCMIAPEMHCLEYGGIILTLTHQNLQRPSHESNDRRRRARRRVPLQTAISQGVT